MARYLQPVCRLCRREGEKLFLKGERCFSDKCSFEKRNYPPGQHGQKRTKLNDYGIQLREKQKVRRIYGVLEQQFKRYFQLAERQKGITGENLLRILECRLDNIVYRFGFAVSRNEARQLVRHNHFTVNGIRVNIPSYLVKQGDVIRVAEKSRELTVIRRALEASQQRGILDWLELDSDQMQGVVKAAPTRDQIPLVANEQLIVELYSK
jgi:small subunit ribosomal protein S4